jgi:diguanylate cyclase (GGDEF)-like protein/PAS domain S-box-containing protein
MMEPAINPVPLSPSGLPDTATSVLKAYPGPAIYVSGQSIFASNPAAGQLLEQAQQGWWREVEPWLVQLRERGSRSPLAVRIQTDGGLMMVEWTALPVGEGDGFLLLGRNVTLERNLQEVLTDSRDRFRDLVELMADLAFETRADGTFSYIAGGKSLGYRAEDLLGKKARDFVVRQPLEIVDYFDSHAAFEERDVWLRRSDGIPARVLLSVRPLFSHAGEWRGLRGVCRDVTEEREHQAELAHLQRRDRLVAQFVRSLREAQQSQAALEMAAREVAEALVAAGCGIYTTDQQGNLHLSAESGGALPELVNSHNRKIRDMGRNVVQESLTNSVLMGVPTVHGEEVTGAIWVWRPAKMGGWAEVDKTLLQEVADHLGIAISQFDYQEKLRILSECDGLTRLLNRRTFMEKLSQKLAAPQGGSALFYVDLDNFKAVNDTHGHQRGDIVIRKLAEALHQMAKPGDLAGRIGGDEFVLWCEKMSEREAGALAARLVAVGESLRSLSASAAKPLGVSVGVVLVPEGHTVRAAGLLEQADAAMYKAKREGKSGWALAEG